MDRKALRAELEAVGWRPETIDLPPDFAPALPIGEELLLFAPGMFEAEAEDFWSYVFLMEINETNVDEASLTEMFELYYDGLIGMVGNSRGLSLPADPAQVNVAADRTRDGRFLGTIDTHDAFVTGEPLSLRLVIDVAPPRDGMTSMWIQASPHPEGHPIWSTLKSALGALEI